MNFANPTNRERTAIHEAGHAVVASLSPLLPPVVRLYLTADGGGAVETESRNTALRSTARDPAARADWLGQAIRVLAAGAMAELLAFGELVSDPRTGTDFPKIVKLNLSLTFVRVGEILASDRRAVPKPEEALAWARQRVCGAVAASEFLLRSQWGAVELVAQRLLQGSA